MEARNGHQVGNGHVNQNPTSNLLPRLSMNRECLYETGGLLGSRTKTTKAGTKRIYSYSQLWPSDIKRQVRQLMSSTPRLRLSTKEPDAPKRQGMDNTSGSRSGDAGRLALLSFDEMPEWFQRDNNQWILHGYRPISGSTRVSFCSWWYLHNETINIYSHLIPAVVFLLGELCILQYLANKYSRVTRTDIIVFSCFMLTATVCYAFSALYHTLMNHSYTMDHFYHRLDMLGIAIFIVGNMILGVYIIFWCETTLRNIYWSMVSYLYTLGLFSPGTSNRI